MEKLLERRTVLDLNLEGGLGQVFSDPGKLNAFGRARIGALFVRAPFYESIGITYEYSGVSPVTFGLQGEFAWAGGIWGQAGALMDTSHSPVLWGGMAALGFAILGIETQLRDTETQGATWALYGKLRLPLTLLSLAASASSAADQDRQLQQQLERERTHPPTPPSPPAPSPASPPTKEN